MKTYFSFLILICLGSAMQAQTVSENDSVPESHHTTQTKVKVFPNPATSAVHILGLINSSKADIKIRDIYGNIVLEHHWEIRRNALNIPISTLDPGAYIITIRSNEQQIRTKFYKQ